MAPGAESSHAGPQIAITPQVALADEPVQVRLTGLPPRRPVTVQASMRAWPGHRWASHATFEADDRGGVDLSSQRPLSGTYAIADPMGLIWSMALVPAPDDPPTANQGPLPPSVITVAAELDGDVTVAVARADAWAQTLAFLARHL